MSRNNILLNDLIEPSIPAGVSWLPETVGWKCLAIIISCTLFWILLKALNQFRASAYRRTAIRALKLTTQQLNSNSHVHGEFRRWNSVVKHVACFAYPNSKVAELSGLDWVLFLKETSCAKHIDETLLSKWQSELYQPSLTCCWSESDIQQVKETCIRWVATHDRKQK
ncbi:DUF4381 domain-containing protein [Vibrio makurazakiensis]|uniref:DUF4381 domain-containing protein n=1 Tax=Vibrio makurazakiensis TaxID=2910250 RepID=UPI003D0A62B0